MRFPPLLTAGGLALLLATPASAQLVRRAPPARSTATAAGEIEITLPATIRGGDTVNGRILLPRTAPLGGLRVSFTSDRADLAGAIPAVTVPAFQRTATFVLAATALRGTPAQTVTITASGSGPGAPRGSRTVSIVQAAAAPVFVSSNVTTSPVASVSAAGQAAFQSRLEPAPPVEAWQPRYRVPQGGSVVITGSGFRPADIAVRIGTRKLAVVEASATRIVARAPSASDPGVLDPHYAGPLTVGHAGGQLRTVADSYRVVDRWDGYAPAAVSVTQSQPLRLTDAVPKNWFTKFDVVLEGLPGDQFVAVEWQPADGSCGQQLYSGGTPQPIVDGRVTLSVGMNFRLSATSCSSLKLPIKVRYADAPSDVHSIVVNLGRVQLRTTLRVEKTQELLDAGVLSFTRKGGSGTCAGTVDSTAVGRLTLENDIAFRVHDELLDTACLWALDQSAPGKWILRNDGWTIRAFGWTTGYFPTGQRCHVQLQPRTGSDIGGFYFERGLVFMGDGERSMAPDSTMNVSLSCWGKASQATTIGIDPNAPHDRTVRLDWVDLVAPAGTTRWQQVKE